MRGVGKSGEGVEHGCGVAQLRRHIAHIRVEGGEQFRRLFAAKLIGQVAGDAQRDRGDGLREGLVDLRSHLIGTLSGDFRGDGVDLLVRVVGEFRMLHVVGEERHHVLAETGGDDYGRIIFAGFRSVNRIVLGGDGPVELIVGSQRVDHAVTDSDLHRDKAALIPLVGVGDGDFQLVEVAERVPSGGDVEPGEQAGDDDKPDHDDHRDNIAEHAPHITGEKFPCCFHCFHAECLPMRLGRLSCSSSRIC